MTTLKLWVSRIMSYIGAFILGGYLTEINHGGHIEPYRWALTGGFWLFFVIISTQKIKQGR